MIGLLAIAPRTVLLLDTQNFRGSSWLISSNSRCLNYSNWKSKFLAVYEKFIPPYSKHSQLPPVKIAVLDTGVDITHPDIEAREENIKGLYNWFNEKLKKSVHDRNGHGTFIASLLLDYAPDSHLYVAKISDSKPSSPRTIAKVTD